MINIAGSRHSDSEDRAKQGTCNNDDDGSESDVAKKMNLLSFKLNRVYLDPLNMLNTGDVSWS